MVANIEILCSKQQSQNKMRYVQYIQIIEQEINNIVLTCRVYDFWSARKISMQRIWLILKWLAGDRLNLK